MTDETFSDLHQYALELGYSDRIALKTIFLNGGTTLIEEIMANDSNEVIFLSKANDHSILKKYTENGLSLF